MKQVFLISSLLLLFVVNATRVDIILFKMFSENISVECLNAKQAENDTDEKEKEECKDDDSNEYSSFRNKLQALILFQNQYNLVFILNKPAYPAISIDSPPPKK